MSPDACTHHLKVAGMPRAEGQIHLLTTSLHGGGPPATFNPGTAAHGARASAHILGRPARTAGGSQ